MSADDLLVTATDPEAVVLAYLDTLRAPGGPLEGWGLGTRTPENETPEKFIRIQQTDGSNPQVLLYRHTIQIRAWHSSEATAKRYSNLVQAYLRRALGVRVVSQPVRLPDPVDPARGFFQSSVLLPTKGVAP